MEYNKIEAILDKNTYSRPGSSMKDIRGVCLHWVGNPGSTAINNRHYFNNLKNQGAEVKPKRFASSHEIIGLNGEVVICIPKNEVAFHAGATSYKARVHDLLSSSPNRHLYGIEVCHPNWEGKFSDATYKTLVERVADLLIDFKLKPSNNTIWRHFDVTGKDCPRFYVQNPKEWEKLVSDITKRYDEKTKPTIVSEISDWAKEGFEFVVKNKISDGARPKDPVTREEVWTMLYRFKGLG